MASAGALIVAASSGSPPPYSIYAPGEKAAHSRYEALAPSYSSILMDLPPKYTYLPEGGTGDLAGHTVETKPRGNILGRLGKHSMDVMGNIRGLTSGTLKVLSNENVQVIDSGSPVGTRFLGIFGGVCGVIKGVNYIDRGYREYQIASKADDRWGKVIGVVTGFGIGVASFVRGVFAFPIYIMQIMKEYIMLAPAALETLKAFGLVVSIFSLISWVGYVGRSAFKIAEMNSVTSELNAMAKEVIEETYSEGVSSTILAFQGHKDVEGIFAGARSMVRQEVELEDKLLRKIEARLEADPKFKESFERNANSSQAVKEYVEASNANGPDHAKGQSVWQRITTSIAKAKKNETKELLLFTGMLILTILDLCLTGGTFTLVLVAVGMVMNVLFLSLNDVPGYMKSIETNNASNWDRKLLAFTMSVMAVAFIATFVVTGGVGFIPLLVMGIGGAALLVVQAGAVFYKKHQEKNTSKKGELEPLAEGGAVEQFSDAGSEDDMSVVSFELDCG